MEYPRSIALTYQGIGEFVVAFQWVEAKYREIGWFILDPTRANWPPMRLRREKNGELIDKVTTMFITLTEEYEFPNGAERASDFAVLRPRFHALRDYRNRLLHSAFIEMKAGGEIAGYVRASPKVSVDPESGALIHDHEPLWLRVFGRRLPSMPPTPSASATTTCS